MNIESVNSLIDDYKGLIESYRKENKYLRELQRNMDKQYQELEEQLEKKYKEVGTLTNEILYEENTKLLSVLDEIREYIEKDYSFAKRGDTPLLTKDEQLAGKLFEILDKVGSNE